MDVPQNTDELIDLLKKTIKDNRESEMSAVVGRIPLLCQSVLNIHEILKELKDGQEFMNEKLDKKFVTKESFWPVKTIVYGGVGIILTGVLVTVLLLIHIHVQ